MLNELVFLTIIVKFDIIFLELEDNMLIQFKSLTFPQLHLVDLVGSVKTDGFINLFFTQCLHTHSQAITVLMTEPFVQLDTIDAVSSLSF